MLNVFRSKMLLGLGLAIGVSASANAAPIIAPDFAGSYIATQLGHPTDVVNNLGGVTFLDNDTLLIGGCANGGCGAIYSIDITRGMDGHITGYAGAATVFSTAPFIDGGLTFGPGGVLFFTTYSDHMLGQIKPGSTTPDRLDPVTSIGSSTGSLVIVPPGFAGAGTMKIFSYSTGEWADVTLTADGLGTYDFTISAPTVTTGAGPEGAVYVSGSNAGFTADSVLISEYQANRISAYEVDSNGNPIVGTRRDFITGLSGAEGAVIDPLTGDFLFSTFGSDNELVVVRGFIAPPQEDGVPTPGAIALFGLGLLGLGALRRKFS